MDGATLVPELPTEMWELIISHCNAKSLAVHVPILSRKFNNISGEDSKAWREKFRLKYSHLEGTYEKSTTWKRLYYESRFRLFPYMGFTIGKTSLSELEKVPGAYVENRSDCVTVTIKDENFCCDQNEHKLVSMFYHALFSCLPERWKRQGITWEPSFNEYREFLKKRFRNYRVEVEPTIEHFEARIVRITTVIKEPGDVYYQLGITFGCYNKDKRPYTDVRNIVEYIDIRASARQDSELHQEFLDRYKTRLISD